MNIEKYKNSVVQIATPWGTGTGFYLKNENLIVTNNHVVNGAKEVVVSNSKSEKELVNVLFSDEVYDLAFLEVPKSLQNADEINLSVNNNLQEGEKILAVGHPYGLDFTTTQGIVSKSSRNWNGINYIQIDAAINPGNSGGPLIDQNGDVVGVNTFILSQGQNLGFALPVSYLKEIIAEFKKLNTNFAIRCSSCSNLLTEKDVQGKYCSHCGAKIDEKSFSGKKYVPNYAGNKIEQIISKLNYDVGLSRVGSNFWEIAEGSAKIKISYDKYSKYIVAFSTLCRLPKENIGRVYEYLLDQNSEIKSMSFSVKDQDIVLSTLYIHEEDMHIDTGVELFKNLFLKSDYYDDILIEMGAREL